MIYLADTANIEEIKELFNYLPIEGVTTNPTIVKNSGKPISQVVPEIQECIGDKALHFQVISNTAEEIIKEVNSFKADNTSDIIVIDAPIPIEHGFVDQSDEIWVVTASRENRISRIMERNNLTREDAERRIDSQQSDEAYIRLADEVIINEGSIEELENNVAKLFVKIKGLR